jgi:hypothetical protein
MVIGGLDVVSWTDEVGLNVPVRARLALALDLIDRYAPRLGARLRRDVLGIALYPAGGTSFNVKARTVVLDVRWCMYGTIEEVASSLIHEATHARCTALGVRYLGKERREEALCLRQEIAFADLLEPGQLQPPSLDALDRPWWTPKKRAARMDEAMKILGLPVTPLRWIGRVLRFLRGGGW